MRERNAKSHLYILLISEENLLNFLIQKPSRFSHTGVWGTMRFPVEEGSERLIRSECRKTVGFRVVRVLVDPLGRVSIFASVYMYLFLFLYKQDLNQGGGLVNQLD